VSWYFVLSSSRSQLQDSRRVAAENHLLFLCADVNLAERVEHLRDAADLMWVIAAGQNVVRTSELDRKLDRIRIEVDRIEVAALEIFARRARDVLTAIGERLVPSIQTLCQIRQRTTHVGENPGDVRISFEHAGENQVRHGDGRIEEKPDQRDEPVV